MAKSSTPKIKYPTDKEVGIRSITQINKLPVSELTDSEICKLFFCRFDANALVMIYEDKAGERHLFGRLFTRKNIISRYKALIRYTRGIAEMFLYTDHDLRQIEEESKAHTDRT